MNIFKKLHSTEIHVVGSDLNVTGMISESDINIHLRTNTSRKKEREYSRNQTNKFEYMYRIIYNLLLHSLLLVSASVQIIP